MAPSIVQAALPLLLVGSSVASLDVLHIPDVLYRDVVLNKRAVAPPATLPGTWTYQGCYTDPGPRTLSGNSYSDGTAMTDETCISYCAGLGFIYAGTEYSSECYCGNSVATTGAVANSTDCNMGCSGNSTEACGGPNRLTVFWNGKTAPPGPMTNPGALGFGYLGCYTEGTNVRALSAAQPAGAGGGTNMTVANCIAACSALSSSYIYAGMEYASECYCGTTIDATATAAPGGISDCSMTCSGNSSEYCGASNRLDVYKKGYTGSSSTVSSIIVPSTSTTKTSTSSSTKASTSTTSKLSTSSSSTSSTKSTSSTSSTKSTSSTSSTKSTSSTSSTKSTSSTSSTKSTSSTSSTKSTSSTSSTKSSISSTSSTKSSSSTSSTTPVSSTPSTKISTTSSTSKSGSSTASSTSSSATSSSATSSSSTSSSSTSSSGTSSSGTSSSATSSSATSSSATIQPSLKVVQAVSNYVYLGCYTEGTNERALTPGAFAADTMTVESCQASCSAYTYFGVEYGRECYCGNTIASTAAVAPETDCSFTCAGNQYEYCGAGNRLNVYVKNGTATSTAATGTTTSTATGSATGTTTSASIKATATPSSAATGLPTGWKYAGCYTEGTGGRALSYQQTGGDTNSVETCVNTCVGLGYTVAGMEYSSQCFCDNSLHNGAASTTETSCSMACAGNANEKCGAGDILSIYNTGNLTVFQPPASQSTDLPGNWVYQGCYSDNVNDNRALFWQSILTNNNTATTCLNLCAQYGYSAAGTEYGLQCFCGDDSVLQASGSTKQAETDCNVPCSGDSNYYCGAGNRLSYYKWVGTPALNVWATPAAGTPAYGAYQFLIGGVVVPLITTTGVNGKVTFMEKSGTGAPNTTGAYELDLAQLNNFTGAWRPMHVKSDIFCSASITLPDKAGRQLNIGGWAGASTYGVRIYWPDGSPGVWGTHDWQENVNELSLLAGRWYPSAMIMTNGSVLVMGGEIGSNSAPTPSCEILPLPAGGYAKYLDWLDRTDPNNLYPFMFVLPAGNILVVYYNEARIISEVTFDTIRTLPNLPGSVQNFLAGRTYPLEGTAVLLPQAAPYTDPLTVLVCGGSANGNSLAIDNCVSTQPEVAGANWTIERMPSQRVLSCMAALPDGTYLIVNGARQGVAGFGLATDPNLGALLYDPTKPINQRFTIMANTIVARLYHSEAMLLQDGRVLISGSDPEDGTNPEEYRVEVFMPPYLLNGATKPSFTLTNKDWAYGASITLTNVVRPAGGAARVSMLAAVSSTHGNSMGQRTLFPAASCSGTTCTITAPPNVHICPPGWYQIFLLDGPTPSNSVWIRIGGSIADAAGLGNWPAYSDFLQPGLGAVGT